MKLQQISINQFKQNFKTNKILKQLSNNLSLDYNKEIYFYKGLGNFTINKIYQELQNINNIDNKNIYIIIKSVNRCSDHYIAKIHNHELFLISNRFYIIGNEINTFYRKSDFNNLRIKKDCNFLLIIQDSEKLRNVKNYYYIKPNQYDRYIIKNITNGKYQNSNNDYDYISQIEFIDYNKNEYHLSDLYKTKDINNIFDKNGYYIQDKKQDLIYKAKRLKADREKQQAINYNCKDEIEKATTETNNLLILISNKLKTLSNINIDKIKEINNLFDFLYNYSLYNIKFDIDLFIKYDNNNNFTTKENKEKHLKEIFNNIELAKQKIKAL